VAGLACATVLPFIVRRVLWSVLLLAVVSFITFVVFTILPSADPALLRAGRNPSPAVVHAIRVNLGLDKPWYAQYALYMKRLVLHFDFGYSYQNNIAVRSTIFDRLPATISLAVGGAVVWLISGVAVGIISSIKRGTIIDRVSMGGALLAISAPAYWLGLVAIYLFSKDLGKLVPIFDGVGAYTPITQDPLAWASALVLPWIVLATSFSAVYARFLRSNLLDVMGEDYIRTARAKGVGERTVVLKHGLRSAVTPIVTMFGLDLGILLGGAILIEAVFNIPGIGRLAFDAIQKSDLPTVQGTVLVGALGIVVMNLLVDVLYAFLDPRVRY
ncbi:MAG: peptide/nickel transport system permease protein, partial [Solirubrobacteraceae bacterium]|nr:peptide/nickel transport system permease protein [Solirubrobacteraceae bacterium]